MFNQSSFCALGNGVNDAFGDHCLVCPCGGDRTRRHNLLRNAAARVLDAAGFRPETEKPGLLRMRPPINGADEAASERRSVLSPEGRRPAGIYVPNWLLGQPAAFDFAVTSGLRVGFLEESAKDGSYTGAYYVDIKSKHLDTAAQCKSEGLAFVPMVCEAHGGGWEAGALAVWKKVAKAAAFLSGEEAPRRFEHLMQSLSVTLHRENARAILSRSVARARTPERAALEC